VLREALALALANGRVSDSVVGRSSEQFVLESPMVSFEVIMLDVLADDSPKVPFAKRFMGCMVHILTIAYRNH
jgi:hypothetical protein